MPGPLAGIRVVELAAIGPVPFCGMLLADMGAGVIRIDRPARTAVLGDLVEVCGRGKRSVAIDLKTSRGVAIFGRLVADADVLIEGFRPGVAERLGIGPDVTSAANPQLIYGRMTGWGQSGPMAPMAGHDINYIGLAGALHAIGGDEPVPPLNLIGDYGGGALYLTVGILAALVERTQSRQGQVIDACMVDGTASMMTPTYQLAAAGLWEDRRRSNLLDGAAPFYRTYRTSDGKHVAVGALEPQFFTRLMELLGLSDENRPAQLDRSGWPELAEEMAAVFASQTRDHWERLFDGEDACVTPVLSLEEAPDHEQNRARNTFMTGHGKPQPAAAPRFSRTPSDASRSAPVPGADTLAILAELDIAKDEMHRLEAAGVVGKLT